ncbi:MAG TPA: tetratricopeptide repeat protein [Pyrinomonadaceae bacterium]|nr:tetratricopeptide repeat protein [Pyrinomonadaceae bacterium]
MSSQKSVLKTALASADAPRLVRLLACSVLHLLVFVSLSTQAEAAQEFARATVIERVVCAADASQSYALYLPSNYTTARRWPIIYGFDPAARGRVPVELFREAAEKYGFILVGSNNSRNGSDVDLTAVVKALWDDTHARFSIDGRRVYAAGMSGGARVAFAFARSYGGRVAGVMGFGAGFPPGLAPSREMPFVVYAAAGADDFNQPELFRLDNALDDLGIAHRVETFEGGHEWPPNVYATRSVEWMEIQAMRAGVRERDETFVAEQLARALKEARAFETAGDFYNAHAAYRALSLFKGLQETAEFERAATRIRESKEFKAAFAREREAASQQQRRATELDALARALESAVENRFEAETNLRDAIKTLRRQAAASNDSTARRIARRVLEGFSVQVFQEVGELFRRGEYARAATRLEVVAEVKPEDAGARYVLARAYALGGRKKKALDALREAVERGFKDSARVEQNRDFDALRGEAAYKRLVEELKQKN